MSDRFRITCSRDGCRQRVRLNVQGWQQFSAEKAKAAAAGGRAGMLCPECFKGVLDDPGAWGFEMELGELMVEAMVDKPRWRFVISPAKRG